MATRYTDGSITGVNSAIAAANSGDTILIPPGTFVWSGATNINLNKAITLQGFGTATVIQTGITTPVSTFNISSSGVTVGWFDFEMPGALPTQTFALQPGCYDWRITNVTWNQNLAATGNYFLYGDGGSVQPSYGLIDTCNINVSQDDELCFIQGTNTSWSTPSSMGTGEALYIENCTFNGNAGYVTDTLAGARAVVRFNKITGNTKVDAHGAASQQYGTRHYECYNNTWSYTAGSNVLTAEFRGGSGRFFNNSLLHPILNAVYLEDYSYQGPYQTFNYILQTLYNYPINQQIGVGPFTGSQVAASEPFYLWNNVAVVHGKEVVRSVKTPDPGHVYWTDTVGYPISSTHLNLVGGPNITQTWYAGNCAAIQGDTSGRYLIANTQGGPGTVILSTGLLQAISSGTIGTVTLDSANVLYQYQTGIMSAVFTEPQVIAPNQDFFWSTPGQTGTTSSTPATPDGTQGVSVGTYAQMQALVSSGTMASVTQPVGFWCTDRGDWNKSGTGGQGVLYTWQTSGGTWAPTYTPYTYPHPLRAGKGYVVAGAQGHAVKVYER